MCKSYYFTIVFIVTSLIISITFLQFIYWLKVNFLYFFLKQNHFFLDIYRSFWASAEHLFLKIFFLWFFMVREKTAKFFAHNFCRAYRYLFIWTANILWFSLQSCQAIFSWITTNENTRLILNIFPCVGTHNRILSTGPAFIVSLCPIFACHNIIFCISSLLRTILIYGSISKI